MKKPFLKNAILATGLLFAVCLIPGAHAGTSDGDVISGGSGIPSPRLRATVNLEEGYNDNVFTTNTNKTSSAFTQLTLNGFADLGNERTVFTIGVGGGVTYYYSRPGDKTDKLANITLNLVHKVNERLVLTLTSYSTYQVQPQFDLLVAQNRVNGQYYYTAEAFSAAYQWTERFSTVTGYSVTGIFYEEAAAKKTNDYVQQTFSNQFRYMWTPTTTLVTEYRFGLVNYLYSNQLNSITNYGLVGFDHSFSPKASMTLRAGGEIQDAKVGGNTTSPYAEITANYQYQRYSSLHAYLNYGLQYSNLTISQTDKSLRTGLAITHGLTPRLSFNLGVFYEHDDFSQSAATLSPAYTEDTINVNTGLSFAVTPKFTLGAGYQHTSLLSNSASLKYDQNLFTINAGYSF